MAPLAGDAGAEPGDMDDDLPPLVGEDGQELPPDTGGDDGPPPLVGEDGQEVPQDAGDKGEEAEAAAAPPAAAAGAEVGEAEALEPEVYEQRAELPEGMTEDEALKATAALHAVAGAVGVEMQAADSISAADAMKLARQTAKHTEGAGPEAATEVTKRMVTALAKDDFEEVEDAIFQGADVNQDCGGGMQALHITALRGESFLTELLIAHRANVNARDLSGNSALLYTCHFFKQHKRGVAMVAQLLHHRADPGYACQDGKMAGMSCMDIMDKECRLPQLDENAPRQMKAMLQLAMDGRDEALDAIDKMWYAQKSMPHMKKLFEVSSKKDNFDYTMKNVKWSTPDNAKNKQEFAPVLIEEDAKSILEEKFTYLKDYSFSDEGEKVKVYVDFPDEAAKALSDGGALTVDFEFQAFDLKLRGGSGSYRLRIEPLFGTIDGEQCKHRVSAGSKKVTITLVKRHKYRNWVSILKPR